jgi:hypothetical protein
VPYLPLDLDAKRKCALIATATGIPVSQVGWGLTDVWEHVWRTKVDTVPLLVLAGCFSTCISELLPYLLDEDFGFLEELAGGRYRVRGAKKWLLGMEGRSRGGQAAKSNLIPGARQKKAAAQEPEITSGGKDDSQEAPSQVLSAPAETQPRASREAAESQPRPSRDPLSADSRLLHPASSIQHPDKGFAGPASPAAPNKPKKPPASDPRLKPLTETLASSFRAVRGCNYAHQGAKDAEAGKRLLSFGDIPEIDLRWRRGLTALGYNQVHTIAELSAKWNHLAQPATAPRPVDPDRPQRLKVLTQYEIDHLYDMPPPKGGAS